MFRRAQRLRLGSALLLSLSLLAIEARAEPSVWTKARQPEVAERAASLAEVERILFKLGPGRHDLGISASSDFEIEMPGMREVYLFRARKLLEAAGGAESPEPRVRWLYGHVLRRLAHEGTPVRPPQLEQAIAVLLTVTRSRAPDALRVAAWHDVAIGYAVLGKRDEEIAAYDASLALEPMGPQRALILANRAESYMGQGKLEDAIRGYRESLRSLVPIEMFSFGVTTLWGLGVALDRDGDLEGGLASIALARAYDPDDKKLHGDGWFYSSPHDEAWYEALGAWSAARETDLGAVRVVKYGEAIGWWEQYVLRAPTSDPWLGLAKVRLDACKQERERVFKAARAAAHP